ncbi:TonB-dependent receptor domain-containing protein [Vulgatibacter incomptus]|uniref:TonB family protein / TonB-dependent receptor n=1 Tax=Vulgatibacter incomptus TaxID=1391653 RepID=A0A0K1PF17_9BACT|nr:TonB-dependent receptor [Vulgatibacter incomptus]AKU92102.1 TonB family protein / TonB-dependent receptor [Vulgatibacter incomptus]
MTPDSSRIPHPGSHRLGRLAPALASLSLLLGVFAPDTSFADPTENTLVPPTLTHFVEADFPESEANSGEGASVVLLLSISATGEVVQAEVAESGGEAFDAAALEAARQFVFEPATSNGTPIPVRIGYRYDFVWKPKLERKETADFEGLVRDRATKVPVAGVTISLGSGETTVTADDGTFRFDDIQPGVWSVSLSGDKLVTVSTEEAFEASHLVEATYEVELASEDDEDGVDFEIVVSIPKVKKQVVSTEILADEGRKVPGTQGDVLKVVENMPGVARAAAGSGQLVVWGASPQDTRVYADGLRLPRLYHDGGYRSVIHSDLVRSVELIPGGYGPAYGRGLGGIVAVELRDLDEEGVHGSAEINAIDASLSTRAALSDDVHIAIAARRSHLDGVVGGVAPLVTKEDVSSNVPIPRFWDGQARLVWRASASEKVEVGGMLSSDRLDHNLSNPDPALETSRSTSLDFQRLYARYERQTQSGAKVSVTGSVGADTSSLVELYGGTPIELREDSRIYGLRATWRGLVATSITAELGVDGELVTSTLRRAGSIGAPSREGDPTVFGRPPPAQINADTWETMVGSIAPFAQLDISLFEGALHVMPGLRAEPFVAQTSRSTPKVGELPAISIIRQDAVIEPRLAVRWSITPRIGAKAAFGLYHQPPQADDLSAVFGTPTLGISSARHALLGGSYRITDLLELEATGFVNTSDSLAVRSLSAQPALAEALSQDGKGRSYGGQLMLRQDRVGPFFGWLSYSLVRSERQDTPGGPWRPFDYDQLHVLTAVGSFDLGAGVELGGRVRFATGFPRTPVVGSYYDAATDRYQPIFGEQGSVRIPSFFSADLRLSKRIELNPSELELYLDVQNLTNHRNAEELVYDTTFAQQDYISGFPILPMVGARWSW